MKKLAIVVYGTGILLIAHASIHSSGFLIYEQGARAMAMAGAFVSVANNPTAIFYNPAGIAWLEGTQISIGSTWITANSSLSLPRWPDPRYRSVNQERQWFYPSTFYLSQRFNERIVVGVGFYSAYGLGTKWPKDYPLRSLAVSDTFNTYFFNPTISIKFNEDLSLGFGISYIHSTLNLEAVRLVEGFDVPLFLGTSGNAWGINSGVLYSGEEFSFGFIWRGGFEVNYSGGLTLDTSELPSNLQGNLPSQGNASTTLRFPHIFGLGTSFALDENLILAADLYYVLWSSYDTHTLKIDFPDPFPDEEQETVENWKNTFAIRTGLEYLVNESLALRTGILFDQTPQPQQFMDPILPDADRVAFTGGFGYRRGNIVVDLAYQLEVFFKRKSPNRNACLDPLSGINLGEGTYSTTAHLIGVSIGYEF